MSETSGFKDHFSSTAAGYSRFRPRYPDALFAYLAALCPSRDLAWDCGCGSGQAAPALAPHFQAVLATDPSTEQLAKAPAHPKVAYRQAAAEASGLAPAGVDLVVAAQAAHWFDLDAFYAEVRRVAKPAGVIALVSYRLLSLGDGIDALIEDLHGVRVGSYWPPERRHVDAGYRTLAFPFVEMATPDFAMHATWTLDHLLGYIGTWSAVTRCRRETGEDPVAEIAPALRDGWGDPKTARQVTWPLTLRVARVFED